ncbi:PaaI family thioesterase [Actinocrinis puniceicyclus]|uniref:Medium/long-chain acyl-CoA thioesterase YigI n=1 Tax=Actinocrinis puniceicyclus TaxID=977794 RepID=A0A8J8BE47_9ACTN|nr:PaaI family thioesterase [Actinocrinis puniceicyclus]MBS2964836.1 PaaI family thioesterase [Actinocrinis puniceicyclus]
MSAADTAGTLSAQQDARLRESIGRQTLLTTLGISVVSLAPGRVVLELPFREDICQQNGFVHAGAITTLADSACGYAAMSLRPADRDILTVEFKVNLMAPARGKLFHATATVVRGGRNLAVCSAEVLADGDATRPIALMQATMAAVDAQVPKAPPERMN